jgi:shikimate dehydrogenase
VAATPALIRLALFGSPVGHSASPRIHTAFAREAGLEVEYRAIETPLGQLETALQTFTRAGGHGCNITLPLKGEAMQLAVHCSEHVALAEAANTLVRAGDHWRAESTDGIGLIADIKAAGIELDGARLAILGAGGAAAGILAALLDANPAEVGLYNRTERSAFNLARRHQHLGPVFGTGLNALAGAGRFDLLINATSSGHNGQLPPISPSLFKPGAHCYDLNYGPAAVPLHNWCKEHHIGHRDGLGMLVAQAAASFELWTGFKPETAPVLEALRSA